MHTLNDMNHDDMALSQHFDDGHDYGLEAPSTHPSYLDATSEFYSSPNLMQESKYHFPYATNKVFNNRGLRLFGNFCMINACFNFSKLLLISLYVY